MSIPGKIGMRGHARRRAASSRGHFSLATFVFLLLAIAPRRWTSLALALTIAAVFSFGLNALFAQVFNVVLPRGILG